MGLRNWLFGCRGHDYGDAELVGLRILTVDGIKTDNFETVIQERCRHDDCNATRQRTGPDTYSRGTIEEAFRPEKNKELKHFIVDSEDLNMLLDVLETDYEQLYTAACEDRVKILPPEDD